MDFSSFPIYLLKPLLKYFIIVAENKKKREKSLILFVEVSFFSFDSSENQLKFFDCSCCYPLNERLSVDVNIFHLYFIRIWAICMGKNRSEQGDDRVWILRENMR
jgi:hypothetical protein